MAEYEIKINWVQAWQDGFWEWTLHRDGKFIHNGSSYWRWTGLRAAKRYAKRHARSKIPPTPDDGSRTIKYTVWDR